MLRRAKITGPVILILLSASATIAQQSSQPFSATKSFPEPPDAASFEFSTGDYLYRIAENGKSRRSSGNEKSLSFSLRLNPNYYLTRELYCLEYGGDLILIGEVSNIESGMGFIARLDGATLRLKWKQVVPAFNVGQGLRDGGYAYVTGIGFVGKVNLKSGAFVWRHGNLYRRTSGAFTSFELPEVKGNEVVFTETPYYLRKKQAVIRIKRQSGKIVSINS